MMFLIVLGAIPTISQYPVGLGRSRWLTLSGEGQRDVQVRVELEAFDRMVVTDLRSPFRTAISKSLKRELRDVIQPCGETKGELPVKHGDRGATMRARRILEAGLALNDIVPSELPALMGQAREILVRQTSGRRMKVTVRRMAADEVLLEAVWGGSLTRQAPRVVNHAVQAASGARSIDGPIPAVLDPRAQEPLLALARGTRPS